MTSPSISLGCLNYGGTLVFPDLVFKPSSTLDAIEKEKLTFIMGAPATFHSLITEQKARPRDLKSLVNVNITGDPHTPEIVKDIQSVLGVNKVSIGYGSNEASCAIFITPYTDPIEKSYDKWGVVTHNFEVKLVDEQGELVPVGEVGELYARGPQVFSGYLKDANTTRYLDDEGWFRTEDLARFDDEMYLEVKGRRKEIVLTGGTWRRHMPEIERFLNSHPDIEMSAAFGVPMETGGENVCAWIKMKPGKAPLTLEDVRKYGLPRVAAHNLPDCIRIVDSFPLSALGKVHKPEARRQELALRNTKT